MEYNPYPGSAPQQQGEVGVLGDGSRIEWVSTSPETISLRGVGGVDPKYSYLRQTSTVTFRVVDKNGLGVPNQMVGFSLDTTTGGLVLSDEVKKTDAQGYVSIVVSSGNVSTPVWVTAMIPGRPDIPAQSVKLVVSTGVPTQESFTIRVDAGGTVTVTLSDRNRNPVPDGTAVVFMAEGGQIQDSCITKGGECQVTWKASNPLPSNGRVTIMAFAIGEESFKDFDADGYKDPQEPWTDIGEAFVDENEDGVWNQGEPYRDFNGNGRYDGPNDEYNGWLCDPDGSAGLSGDEGLCPGQHSLHVFGNAVINLNP